MKDITVYIVILLSAIFLMPSCIEEYHGDWETEDQQILVVGGSIESESLCTFILRRSTPISNTININNYNGIPSSSSSAIQGQNIVVSAANNYVKGATVSVESESGAVYECSEIIEGHFQVQLEKLNHEDKYFLRVTMPDGEVYTSTPMNPIDAPEITAAGWKKEGNEVKLNVTTEDLSEQTYLSWSYLDIWEIQTPFVAYSEYDPETDMIKPMPNGVSKNRGWFQVSQHSRIVGDNRNYGFGALKHYPLYSINKDSQCFMVKYYTRIRQVAISREEYEYNNLILLFNSQMGGLFTPMPSELPTNIRSNKGRKAVGYIGVRGHISEAGVCIGRNQVDCKYYVRGEVIPSDRISGMSYADIYSQGLRIYEYSEMLGVTWTYRYCIDATDWGASLTKPSFWDSLEFTPEDTEE